MRLLIGAGLGVLLTLALAARAEPPKGVAPGGFTIHIGLIDFFMIQRGLMLLPDQHAQETLASIRAQVSQSAK